MHDTHNIPASFLKNYFKVYIAFVISHIAFLIFFLVITGRNSNSGIQLNHPELYIILGIIIASVLIALYFFKKQVRKLTKPQLSLKEKLKGHLKAITIKYAMMDVPIFLAFMSYYLSGEIIYLLLASILIVYLISLKPKRDTIANELQLNREERLTLQKEDKEIE